MLDFSQKKEKTRRIIEKPGFYEMELKAEWAETSKKVPYINCIFTVRSDVNQEYQGMYVYDGIYKSSTTGDFNYDKIQALIETQVKPNYQFEDYDELIQHFNGLLLRAEVLIEEADDNVPNSKRKNVIKYCSYAKTNHPTKGSVSTPSRFDTQPTTTDVSDDEIPF